METVQQVAQFLAENAERHVDELKDFLRIASVSADSAYDAEMQKGADFVVAQMTAAGLDAQIVKTDGHPIVYGSRTGVSDAPTVLLYGHYDVQPPDPVEDWLTPPFEPDVRDGCLFARGATDDKGQLFTHLKAIAAWNEVAGSLPVNVKVIIEGEEEIGSSNLDRFLEERKEQLAADVAVISDTSQYAPGMPAISYALRGILACEVTLTGPSQDLHSGVFGGAVANPVNALAKMIGELHDADGRVQIPGFYDKVVPLSDEERRRLADLPFDEAGFLNNLGVDAPYGEAGYTTLERRWARPTCDVNGFFGGYQGEGPKTIVPSVATAKITCRLVPDQDAHELTGALQKMLEAACPPGLKMTFTSQHGGDALIVDTTSPYMAAARRAIHAAWGVDPVLIREGGSLPVVASLKQILGIDTLLLGWGQNTDNLHSPNEHFNLEDFHRGTLASAHLWEFLARG